MTQIAFPYAIDNRRRTDLVDEDRHIRDLIEQVLFTNPGERVNRPDFGAGVMQLVFAPGDDEMAAAAEFLIRGSLQQWLGERIQIEAVQVRSAAGDAALEITIQYLRRRDQQRRVVAFNR